MGLFDFLKGKDKGDKEPEKKNTQTNFSELTPVTSLMVKLLYADKPTFDFEKLLENLKKNCGNVGVISNSPADNMFSFAFLDHPIQLADRKITAQCAILPTKGINKQEFDAALQQSWHFKGARAVIEKTTSALVASDIMSSVLDIKTRAVLFQKFLIAAIEASNCIGIYWPGSQKILDPKSYIELLKTDFKKNFLEGLVNIRLFNVGDGGYQEKLMDTTGLNALGLPDLQLHFLNIDPLNVSVFLSEYSKYIYENGDVLRDGSTVDGYDPGTKWLCRRQTSLAPPDRTVIHVIPDGKYLPH